MTYSIKIYTGTGTTNIFQVPFDFIHKEHVEVRLNGAILVPQVDYTWPTATSIALTAGNLNSGSTLEIRRNTPKVARLVEFQDASVLTEEELNLNSDQMFNAVQEAMDEADTKVGFAATGTVDFLGYRLINVGDPIDPTDGANKKFADGVLEACVAKTEEASQHASAASTSATNAAGSATAAAGSASVASAKEILATQSASTATAKASEASSSAASAAQKSNDAASSATAATLSAQAAAASAQEAAQAAVEAEAAAGFANGADGSAISAAASAENAAESAAAASTSATNAAASASNASGSATTATTQASAASSSASTASTKATEAASSATSAQNSAATATAKASEAATSASDASTSATDAATSASTATSKASAASTSASNAATSATNANNAASSASDFSINAGASASAAAASAQAAAASALLAGGSGDTVKVSSTDSTAGTLIDKIEVGTGLTKTKMNNGGSEKIKLEAATPSFPIKSVCGVGGDVTAQQIFDAVKPLSTNGAGWNAATLQGYTPSSFATPHSHPYVATDSRGNVGTFYAICKPFSQTPTAGTTVAGSSIDTSLPPGTSLPGTWRIVSASSVSMGGSSNHIVLYQRIS